MLVDNSFYHNPFSSSFSDYATDLSDILHTELFAPPVAPHHTSPSSSGSRASSPPSPSSSSSSHNPTLLTPPHPELDPSFQDPVQDINCLLNFYDDGSSSLPSAGTYDIFDSSSYSNDAGVGSELAMDVNLSMMGLGMGGLDDAMRSGSMQGIDPQLVDSPSQALETDEDDESSTVNRVVKDFSVDQDKEKMTLTIAPVKVGGHGKARKGTVQNGGIVKNTSSSLLSSMKKDKENTTMSNISRDQEDDGDDLPHDWRPSPEVIAKMTSKERRQLRNKISARNFRIRRKEYITVLEGDIAERDRLLDAIRSELGASQSENFALRQEIEALKRTLGSCGANDATLLSLPPPAPLPAQSVAATLVSTLTSNTQPPTSTSNSSNAHLFTANTRKDLPTSPRLGQRFWGGVVGGMGGITPVHTTLVPDIPVSLKKSLQENMNPAMNGLVGASGAGLKGQVGFDGFVDLNPFTMKTLDAYRMHLWGKMAAQQQSYQYQLPKAHHQHEPSVQQQPLSGIASNLRPHFFNGWPKPTPSPFDGSVLSTLLSGKATTSVYPPPASPKLAKDATQTMTPMEKGSGEGLLAAMASHTLLSRLSSVFWEAFSGSSSSKAWDIDQVRKVLEGKAVLRVVDVEPMKSSTRAPSPSCSNQVRTPAVPEEGHARALTDLLEESMRTLTIARKL